MLRHPKDVELVAPSRWPVAAALPEQVYSLIGAVKKLGGGPVNGEVSYSKGQSGAPVKV